MLESKRRAIIFILVSVLLAAAAGYFVLKKVSELNAELGGMTEIYVAARDIPSRTLIERDQVKTVEIPNRYLNNSHVTDVGKLINKVLVVPLAAEDVITKTMIKPVSNVRDENNRLLMIPQSERVNFDQKLEALDRVDIVVSHNFDGKPVTEIFMKDVPVTSALESNKKFNGIVVEVPEEEAPKIIHMQNYAESMRILKANVGKEEQVKAEEPAEGEKADAGVEEAEKQKAAEQKAAEQKAAEQKAAEQKKKEEQAKANGSAN
ncbi:MULTISPECIES: Flp pilus assembly protein CpaB [Bacillaceae]|uniref:Flp pilus assembly protein CpaB n=1 Tax=Bacillaceae TaxID=186817 RepID=UPI002964AA3F|nr:SAF domain-containing protein [Bacillus infantis]MDW2879564.1 flagella basal body P-ring formation protein FlgA [Bacillus infantis]